MRDRRISIVNNYYSKNHFLKDIKPTFCTGCAVCNLLEGIWIKGQSHINW